jgi:signal transduction histidine kinase
MEEQLRQKYKMEAVGTLAGGIAHDFNNILAGIMGYADVIAGQTPPDTAAHRNLTQIRKAVMRARGLVKQLLTFSRSAEQDYSAVDMAPVVAEVVEMIRAMAPASVAVADNISSDVCRVLANPVQIHAIVLNLCYNALQAMPDGGVLEVLLDKAEPGSGPAGSCCRLVVRDTGQGMTADVRERIFEPYFTTRPPGQGTGLGLSVVHGVVANLGGTITVDTTPGAGSTFRILFPMMKEEAGGK